MKVKYLLIYIFSIIPFVVNGQVINFDDPIFKSILLSATDNNNIAQNELYESIAIDSNGNGEIEVEESEQVYELFVPINSNISSLQGIEFFSNLSGLHCTYNMLTELNVSMLTNLKRLTVNDNQLEILEVNAQIETLHCSNNQIENLDFSQTVMLRNLSCINNNLTELNLLNAQVLRSLNCRENQLSSLIIQSLPLMDINCANNLLTELDLTGMGDNSTSGLLYINCSNNLLTSLDTTVVENSKVYLTCRDNPNLVFLNLKNGEVFYDSGPPQPPQASVRFDNNYNLEFICADEFNFDYLQTKLVESSISNCELTSDCTLDITEFKENNFVFYPNPIKDFLVIKCPSQYNYLVIYSIVGQVIHKTNFENDKPIALEFISPGNYIAKVFSENGIQQFKIIKE